MTTESIVVLSAIVVSIVVGSFSRVWGRLVGLLLVGAILGWGIYVYSAGRELAFFGRALAATWFYVAVGALFAWEVIALSMALRARTRAQAKARACPACGRSLTHEEDGKSVCGSCQHTWS